MTSRWLTYGRPTGAAVLLLGGGTLHAIGVRWADWPWWSGLIGLGIPMSVRTILGMFRGRFAADVVAVLSVLTAIALAQPLAGLVIVLMQTGGEALDRYAEGRASEAVRALEATAPRVAHRRTGTGWEDVPVELVVPGEELLVRPGEMVPCDGVVLDGISEVDASRLTGESLPHHAELGIALLSGTLNLEGALILRATRPAAESQYARIVRLVRSAQATKAPLQREADRWAVWFTPATLFLCGIAWLLSHDPLRVLAVLVVATPCPLILAAPVAVIGGIDRGAKLGLIFRNGTALEQLGRTTVALFDKTGTVTIGRPELDRVTSLNGAAPDDLLALAAAVEQGSGHHLARSVVQAAAGKGLPIPTADEVIDVPGRGAIGRVGGQEIVIGSRGLIAERVPRAVDRFPAVSGLVALVTVAGEAAAQLHFADQVRPEATRTLAELRELGFARIVLLSGDQNGHTQAVAWRLGVEEAHGELLPGEKLAFVKDLQQLGERVLMVGDGTNDAPALSAADVGVALAEHGGGVSAEAAGLVLLQNDLGRLPLAVALSRRTLRVARQSIGAGLGLSGIGMILAVGGLLTPVVGALIQEAVDVAVILWALRAAAPLVPGPPALVRLHRTLAMDS